MNDTVGDSLKAAAKAGPAIETSLCELVTHPDKYTGRIVQIRAVVEQGFEVSLLVDSACSARIWLDAVSANFDEETWRRFETSLRSNNGVAVCSRGALRSCRTGLRSSMGNGFGHLGAWQSQLVMTSFKG